MKPEIALIVILITILSTIIIVVEQPSIGIQISIVGFLLNFLTSILTKKQT